MCSRQHFCHRRTISLPYTVPLYEYSYPQSLCPTNGPPMIYRTLDEALRVGDTERNQTAVELIGCT
eukprot:scaffold86580_cov19-Prasinocladus_malaysianus.AAC.1